MRSAAIGCMVIYGLAALAAATDDDPCAAVRFELDDSSYSKLTRSDVTGCCKHWAPAHGSGCDPDVADCEHKCVSYREAGKAPTKNVVIDFTASTTEECNQKCEKLAPRYCSEWEVVQSSDYDEDEWPLHSYKCTNWTTTKPTPPKEGVCECLKQVDECKRSQLNYNRAADYVDRCTHNIRRGERKGFQPGCYVLRDQLWDKRRQYCNRKQDNVHNSDTTTEMEKQLEKVVSDLMSTSHGSRNCPKAKDMCKTEMLNCAEELCDKLRTCHTTIQTCLKRLK